MDRVRVGPNSVLAPRWQSDDYRTMTLVQPPTELDPAAQSDVPRYGPVRRPFGPAFAALDLGTNNCRMLVATPASDGFRVLDSFSRIVRLGEGLHSQGALSEDAMGRALDALSVCAGKIEDRKVTRARFVATEACRQAANCEAFLARVREEIGIDIEIISSAEEARLVVAGCADRRQQDRRAR